MVLTHDGKSPGYAGVAEKFDRSFVALGLSPAVTRKFSPQSLLSYVGMSKKIGREPSSRPTPNQLAFN